MTKIQFPRSARIAAHAYTFPVARELPRPVVDAAGAETW